MASFQELQSQLTTMKFKRAVVQHLIEYIDTNFRPIAGADAKNKLMTDEKIPVPPAIFESVVSDVLLEVDGDLEAQMAEILSSNVSAVAVQTAATNAPEAPKKGKKSTTKDEVKT